MTLITFESFNDLEVKSYMRMRESDVQTNFIDIYRIVFCVRVGARDSERKRSSVIRCSSENHDSVKYL